VLRLSFLFLFFIFVSNSQANIEEDKWIFHFEGKNYSFQAYPSQKGLPRVSLLDIVEKFKLQMIYDDEGFLITLRNPKTDNFIQFYTFSPHIVGKNFESTLSKAPEFFKVELHLPIDFGDRGLRPLLSGKPAPYIEISNLKAVDVVIDPGHGGNDWGTHLKVNKTVVSEKEITLKFSKILAQELSKLNISNFLTRTEDSFLTLPERTAIANKLKAKIFLSIHVNSSPAPKQRGFEFFVLSLDEQDAESRTAVEKEQQRIPENLPDGFEKALADLRSEAQLEQSLKWAKALNISIGSILVPAKQSIKMGPFYVLYGAEMPSVLLELGFLTHPEDRKVLLNEQTLFKTAQALSASLATSIKQGIK